MKSPPMVQQQPELRGLLAAEEAEEEEEERAVVEGAGLQECESEVGGRHPEERGRGENFA